MKIIHVFDRQPGTTGAKSVEEKPRPPVACVVEYARWLRGECGLYRDLLRWFPALPVQLGDVRGHSLIGRQQTLGGLQRLRLMLARGQQPRRALAHFHFEFHFLFQFVVLRTKTDATRLKHNSFSSPSLYYYGYYSFAHKK